MKLYVWSNPYPVSYGSSMVFAVAESLPAARKQAENGRWWSFNEFGGNRIKSSLKLGKPTRIVALPCAEWHKWEE